MSSFLPITGTEGINRVQEHLRQVWNQLPCPTCTS